MLAVILVAAVQHGCMEKQHSPGFISTERVSNRCQNPATTLRVRASLLGVIDGECVARGENRGMTCRQPFFASRWIDGNAKQLTRFGVRNTVAGTSTAVNPDARPSPRHERPFMIIFGMVVKGSSRSSFVRKIVEIRSQRGERGRRPVPGMVPK